METFKRRKEGITLIALVVTIIVLLILAGVSISVLTGENGLLSRATEAKTTSKIAEIEEQANLEYTAMLIDQLSGKTSENVALTAVCSKLKNDYKLPVQKITTDAPTVTGVIFTSTNLTLSEGGTVGEISIAQGTESTTISAEAVTTEATGSWYAVVEGKYYKIEIPTGQSKINIAREESNVNGGNNTPTVTYAVTSLNPSDSGVTVDSSSGAIKVPNSATGTAVITATAGGQSATCTVTVIQKISSITAIVNNNGKVNVNGKVGITVTPNPSTNVEAVTYSYSIPQANQGTATVNATTGEITGVAVGGPVTVTVTGIGAQSGTEVSTTCQVQVVQSTSEILEGVTNRVTYGKYVNYNIDLGIGDTTSANKLNDDWKVFYDDGTNIYIIAADYVPVSNSYLATAITNMGATASGTYGVYWPSAGFQSYQYKNGTLTKDTATGAADIFATNAPAGTKGLVEKGFLRYWKNAMNGTMSTNNNAKMTASLMDTEIWKGFATGESGAYAIGGPTLSMWAESWNTQHGTNSSDATKAQVYYNRANSTGYYVKAGSQPSTSDYYADLTSSTGYTGITSSGNNFTGDLYFPRKSDISNCYGYWLASPSAGNAGYEVYVGYGGYVGHFSYDSNICGVRPVVCLPSGIGLKTGTNGNYDITNGKWDN